MFFHNFQMKIFVILTILAVLLRPSTSQLTGCLLSIPGTLQCQVCSSALQLDDLGNCKLYTPIQGCLVYNSTNNGATCNNCTQGYLLSSGICLQMIPNCVATVDVNTCDQCASGYTLIRYSNCYSTNVTNCAPGTLPRTVNGVSFCQQFDVLNCANLSTDGLSCATCSPGFTAINGRCFTVQNTIPCPSNSCNCQGYYFSNNCYNVQLSNCLQSSDTIYCDLCVDLYYSANGVCTKFIKTNDINCNVLTPDGLTCAGCNLNYFLNENFICTKNFQLCPNGCSSCPWDGFSLFQNNCYYKDPLCLVYNFTQQTCQLCAEGYNIDPVQLICVKTITCLTRNSNNFCTKCFSGYQLDYSSYQCFQLPNNCAVMNTSSAVCLNCTQGTSFFNSQCVFLTNNCTAYNGFGYCQTCASGFVQTSRACVPVSANCQTYGIDQSVCSVCMAGFRLSGQQCFLTIQGCLAYASQSNCISCGSGYLLANGNCFFNDVNCVSQDSNGLCQQCLNGYLPFKSRCVFFDPYCLAYDPTSMTCSQSSSAFSSAGGFSLQQQLSYLNFVIQAQSFAQNSASADFNGGAGQGSYTKDGKITSLPYAGLSSSSIGSYDMNGNILTCKSGFSLVNTQCVVSTANCMSYNQMNTCQQCNPGFDLLANGSCSFRSSSTCARQAGGICLQAASGYSLIGGSAYFAGNNIARAGANGMIVSANAGYFVWSANNIAWPYDFNCVQQTQPGTCLQCASSQYSLSNGKCVLRKNFCIAYSVYGLCMGCQTGYLLFAGQCRKSSCSVIDSTTGFCNSCLTGFSMSLGLCVPTAVQNCQMYNGGTCSFCQAGFYLTSGSMCGKMINNCQTASPQTGRCSQCAFNYTLYQEQCIPQIANCQVYASSLTACTTCNTLFYPIRNGSVCFPLGYYCAAANDAGQCQTCNPGLTKTTQNGTTICIRPISNCFSYDANIKCVRCNSGYVLQFNKCKSIRCSNYNYTVNLCLGCYPPFIIVNGSCIDPNCAQYNQETCFRCLPRYYLSGSNCILNPDVNCLNYSSAGFCIQCAANYTVNQKGICVVNDIMFNGCATPQYPCPKCSIGYFLNGSFCYARRCASYKPNRDCLVTIYYYIFDPSNRFGILYTCTSPACYQSDAPPAGFYTDGNGSLKISNCISYNQASCSQCQNYRYPNSAVLYNLCYPYNCQVQNLLNCANNCVSNFAPTSLVPDGCLAINCVSWDSTGRCLQCVTGYQLVNNFCQQIFLPFCLTIDYSTITCKQCQSGFELFNGYCRASNCNSYQPSNASLCANCSNGYLLDIKTNICAIGKCSQASLINQSRCQFCLLGYNLQNGICYANNCTTYQWSTMTCLTCAVGFELVPAVGICKASNCNTFDSNLICKQCLNTTSSVYALRNGMCVSVDPNCISFDSNGNCLACNNPSIYVNAGQLCILIIQGCISYDASGCISCASAYFLNNGICTVLYCSNYSAPHKCSICQSRYLLQKDFTCYPKNCITFNSQTWRCLTCQPRFQLINSQFCFTYNCTNYSVQNYVCNRCAPGFALNNEACLYVNCPNASLLFCPSCVTGFQLVNGVCQGPKNNCTTYDYNNYVCTKCDPGFNLTILGVCVLVQSPGPFCLSIDPLSGFCVKCLPNFNYNGQSQQCESAFCTQFSSSQSIRNRTCTACATGFVLLTNSDGKYCVPVYCQGYSLLQGFCTGCIGGSTMTNNICYASNCFNYTNTPQISPYCVACIQGYTLSNFLCQAANCQNFNPDLTCQNCMTGFALNNNGICISTQCNPGFVFVNFNCVPANCYNYTSNYCQECLPGFVRERNSCIADSCMAYNDQYVCLQCRTGYNLTLVNGQYLCILIVNPVCPRGYYLFGSSCISITIVNCTIVDPTGAICYHCADGYFLRNGICYSINGCSIYSYITGCDTCILGFTLQGFFCVSLNCQVVNPNNTCASCIQGYTLINNICRAAIYKCLQIDNQGNCLQCQPNFQLTQGYCIAIGCSNYSATTNVCFQCASGYYLNGEICTLRNTIPNCYLQLNATYCSQCVNGYVQLNGNCYLSISFCVSYNPNNGACSICDNGYYLASNNTCNLLPSNCLTANPTGSCTNCAAGYIAASGQCIAATANCQSFDPNTALCLICNPNFYLTANNRCLNLPQFCTAADRSGSCTSCRNGYSVFNGICVVTIANCNYYNPNNPAYCYQCAQAYYLNTVYQCSLLPPFCLSANNLGYCLSCQQGYNLFSAGGICVVLVQNCVSYVQAGSNSTRCVQCASGFTLTNNYTCSSLPMNCLAVNNAGYCIQCATNYQLFSNICVIPVNFCQSYDNSTFFCSVCISGYYLYRSGSNLICQTLPKFCLTADLSGSCLTCISNYIIYNRLCVLGDSILNCQTYDPQSYTCLNCVRGYYLNANYICTLLPQYCSSANQQGQCLSCVSGYQLSGNFCVIYVVNCTGYNYNTGTCTQCAPGYQLSQDQTTCNLMVTNCQVFNPSGLCLQCMSGYYLSNGYCVILPQGCSQLNNQQLCIACLPQFTLVQNVCVLMIANCALYNTSGCYQCLPFFYLYNGACQSFPANCLSFDTSILRCINCASGFTLNPNTFICSKIIYIQNCASYNAAGQCTNCISRYYLRQNSCWAYPQYCVNVDCLGNCLSCAFGSALQNGVCVATSQRSLNCLSFNQATSLCLICMTGYNFCSISGICVLADPGCLTFSNGVCVKCQPSYQLFSGRCLQYPPGVIIAPNGGMSCASGYSQQGNSCFRTTNELITLSSRYNNFIFTYSSNGLNSIPFIGSNTFWSPSRSQLNEYISIQVGNGSPQIIFQVTIQGNPRGWVTGYIIQFKNSQNAPFICWNSCNQITGNSDGTSPSTLNLPHPIIATQLRLYPVAWNNQINMQVQLYFESYQ